MTPMVLAIVLDGRAIAAWVVLSALLAAAGCILLLAAIVDASPLSVARAVARVGWRAARDRVARIFHRGPKP